MGFPFVKNSPFMKNREIFALLLAIFTIDFRVQILYNNKHNTTIYCVLLTDQVI